MIPVQNIYYMLAYAFKALDVKDFRHLATEQFDNVADLCAAILITGVSGQLKRGLHHDYIERTEALSSPRGRLHLSDSIKTGSLPKKQLVCSFDEFSVDSYTNRILKTAMTQLLAADIARSRKKAMRKLLMFFGDVQLLKPSRIRWNLRYNRNNQTYRLLIAVCYLVLNSLLQTQKDGSKRLMDFFDEQNMSRLYEKFILEYFRREFPHLNARASQISWALDNDSSEMLPIMQTDVTLSLADRILIIDAKYYSHTMQERWGKHTLHSGNLYQIFTYVKNKAACDSTAKIDGMLLYARTTEDQQPDQKYSMSGNTISVRTLDLNCSFPKIAAGLDRIAEEYFGSALAA